jgi:hypothetical protein
MALYVIGKTIIDKVREELENKTFYRGTTHYDAAETVQNQAINTHRLSERQADNPFLDYGTGLYMTKVKATANYFAQYQGKYGRQGGAAILRIQIPKRNWEHLLLTGAIEDAPISGLPGHFQSFVPTMLVTYFNVFAHFFYEE